MGTFDLFKRWVGLKPREEPIIVTDRYQGRDRRNGARVMLPEGSSVLVVDDSRTILAVLGKMLKQNGYQVLTARDGEAAVSCAVEQLPVLVFLDIVMPGMNGFAALRELRRREATRSLPVIMMSGNEQATEEFYVQRIGADDFMKKPFSRAEVFARIEKLIVGGRIVLPPGR